MRLQSFYYISIFIFSTGLMTACKKNTTSNNGVYLPLATKTVANVFPISDTPYVISFTACLAGADYPTVSGLSAGSNVNLTFKVDTSLVAAFNKDNGTSYSVMPQSAYTIPASATIAKGQTTTDSLQVSIKGQGILQSFTPYLLPVSIASVSGATANPYQQTIYFVLTGVADINNIAIFDRSAWKVDSVSTQEPAEGGGNGLGFDALDGDPSTYWQTKWAGGEPGPPHFIIIDMGVAQTIHGVAIMDRDFSGSWQTDGHGQPEAMTISLSTDGVNWQDDGSFSNLPHPEGQPWLKNFLPNYIAARYLKITVTQVYGTPSTNIAEIGAF